MTAQSKTSKEVVTDTMGFRLEQLFGSKTRSRLLTLLLNHPEDSYFVRELTRKIDAQLNSVRRELKNLMELGLVNEIDAKDVSEKRTAENKKFYQCNMDSMLFQDLRALLQKAQILLNKTLVQEIDDHGHIEYLALTGKFVRDLDVPVDLFIVGTIDQKALRESVRRFEQELGDEVNFTLMPHEEFFYRKQISDKFLFSVLNAHKVVMIDRLGDK